jgi:uncharacterized protein
VDNSVDNTNKCSNASWVSVPVPDADLVIRADPQLWIFLTPRRRRTQFTTAHDGEASLGHVVQAVGVPLTETGALTLDGSPADPSDRPRPGAVVGIGAAHRPEPMCGATGFLLDVHFGSLARRLRLLGVDTAYGNEAEDAALVERAGRERRILLTQDRGLLMRRALWHGAFVRGHGADAQLADVLDRFAPPLAPWTRCPACNGELAAVPKDEVADQLEPGTRRRYERFTRCRSCGRVYWHGAHGRRLDAVVENAVRAAGHPGRGAVDPAASRSSSPRTDTGPRPGRCGIPQEET